MIMHLLISLIIIIISFFKVDFYITFSNYKKPIKINLPRNLAKNLDTKTVSIHWFNKSAKQFVSTSASTFQWGKK